MFPYVILTVLPFQILTPKVRPDYVCAKKYQIVCRYEATNGFVLPKASCSVGIGGP